MTETMPTPVADPEVKFISPSEIVEHATWSSPQKRKALESWLFTVRARLDAVSEGMTTHPGGTYTKDVELARAIEKAIDELPATSETGGTVRQK